MVLLNVRSLRSLSRVGLGAGMCFVLLSHLMACDQGGDGAAPQVEGRASALSTDGVALGQKAQSAAAVQLGVAAADVSLGPPVTRSLPLTGRRFTRFKAFGKDGSATEVSFDELGQPANVEEAAAAENAAYDKLYGKKTPDLYARLVAAQPAMQKVVLLLNFNDTTARGAAVTVSSTMSRAAIQALPDNTAALRRSYAAATASVRARFLAKLRKHDPAALDGGPDPIVYATLSPSAIAEMERDPDVQSIDRDDVVPEQVLNVSALELGYWTPGGLFSGGSNPLGVDGTGIRIAQIDPYGLVTTTNPNLSNVTQGDPTACYSSHDPDHATAVAGVLKSTNQQFHGLAPGAALYAGGGCGLGGSYLQSTLNTAINWGATAVNASYSDGDAALTSYDSAVYSRNVFAVAAAGNHGYSLLCPEGSDGRVTLPGIAYNVLTVGAYDTNSTPGYPDDDRLYNCSAGDTPSAHGDRVKPEIVAPGANIQTLDLNNGVNGELTARSGTSVAAPMVTGTVALMQQANPGLRAWPGVMKAVILATARYSKIIPKGAKGAGYGRLHTDKAVQSIAGTLPGGSRWWMGEGGLSCSSFARTYSVYFVAGKTARVALVWDNDPTYDYVKNKQPSADLDLRIVQPGGAWVAYSTSFDNTQEVAEWTPLVSGTYTALVQKLRCDKPVTRIALASYQDP